MNKGVVVLAAFVSVILIASSVFAGFTYSNKGTDITAVYSGGESISGIVNLSLTNEPANSLMKSNFNGTIKILELLQKNGYVENTDFTCTFKGCIKGYKIKENVVSLSVAANNPQVAGFKITSNDAIEAISSVKFSVTSSALPSCSRQLLIDVLDQNQTFIQSSKNSGVLCDEELTGCFNYGLSGYGLSVITTNTYCENITLKPAPAYKIGATVKNSTTYSGLTMTLFDENWVELGDCKLPKHAQETEKIGCAVNVSVAKQGSYFVCINADNENSNYKIRTEEVGEKCGTAVGGPPYNIDYEIYANPFIFDSVGTLAVNGSVYSALNGGSDLVNDIQSYLQNVYDMNCSAGCVIPFRFSGVDQELTFSDVSLIYKRANLGTFEENTLYKLESEESKINTLKFLGINLRDAEFSIPIDSKANKLYLYLNSMEILPKPLNISISPGFIFNITPKSVLLGPTTFFQVLTSAQIISSSWDFGDGSAGTASGKSISHRYTQFSDGGYEVSVELTRSDGVKSKNTFDVGIGSLSESSDALYREYQNRLSNLSSDISSFPTFVANGIRSKVDIAEMNASLNAARANVSSTSSRDVLLYSIQDMLAVNPPAAIKVKEEGSSLPLFLGFENMNVDHIISISGSDISSDEEKANLAKAISGWVDKNYEGRITYNVIARTEDEGDKNTLLTWVRLDLTKKSDASEDASQAYLIIDYPKDELVFAGNYSAKAVGSGTYIDVGDSTTIEFLVYDEVPVSTFGIYISPDISKLEGYAKAEVVKPEGFNWKKFFIWMTVLLILALAVYIALQEWYKRRYEAHLFKNPNDLYNILNFIFNSRKSGMDDIEIGKKLKAAGWSGEQINYAFRKIDGRRTGMWEIPIFKFLENRKVRQELAKREVQKPSPAPSGPPQPLLK